MKADSNLQQRIDDAWRAADRDDPAPTLEFFTALHDEDPGNAYLIFEHASAHDWAGLEDEAIPLYERAIAAGLDDDNDRRARIQLGSSLRNVGRANDAVAVLSTTVTDFPDSAAAQCFLALVLFDAGRNRDATAAALRAATMGQGTDVDEYRGALVRYTDDLREPHERS